MSPLHVFVKVGLDELILEQLCTMASRAPLVWGAENSPETTGFLTSSRWTQGILKF